MIFKPKECDLLIKCLRAYLSETNMHTDFGKTVIVSAIEKISNINELTVFSRKEVAAMCNSLDYIEEVCKSGQLGKLSDFSSVLPGSFYPLLQKTNKLYDAL